VRRLAVPIALVSVAIALLAVLVGSFTGSARTATSYQVGGVLGAPPAGAGGPNGAADTLIAVILKAQAHLRASPKDAAGWAGLGAAYIQQALVTSDPTYYPKAQGALQRSIALKPEGNAAALAGMGALLNARHEFSQALDWARKAQEANPYSATVYGVMDDALTQLGDYAGATKAAERMLELQPGVPSFARASYHFEERGQTAAARQALTRALEQANGPADVAFCRYYLGELAFNEGHPWVALGQYTAGLKVDANYAPLLAGRAKARAATGQTAAALRDYATVTARVPQPQYVLEYAELLQAQGRDREAGEQLTLLAAQQQLLAANGVVDDLGAAVVAADHGSADQAVAHAQAEWARRRSVLVADALAWALHRAGRDAEALPYAEQADRLGWRNATFSYHRGMIEKALGRDAVARRDISRALAINPHFSPLQVPRATRALTALRPTARKRAT
jgi:tetratricopeptide (TPR) repeat protein